MKNDKIQNLVDECKRTEEDSTYTAEVHHLIAKKLSKKAFLLKFIPPIVTIFSAFALILGAPVWTGWIALTSGIITAISVFIEPERKSKENLFAAKSFTVLKHEARSLHETFRHFIEEKDFCNEVRRLREKYNLIVQITPPTDDKKCWDEAREKIKEGIHKPDFKEKINGKNN